MIFLECDFIWKTLNVLKNQIRHENVIALKYVRESKCLVSIGSEGNIFVYDVKPRSADEDRSSLFDVLQSHRLIWNSVSAINFLSNSQILAGFTNGVVQYVRFNWKKNSKAESSLYEFHEGAIQHLAAVPQFSDEVREIFETQFNFLQSLCVVVKRE